MSPLHDAVEKYVAAKRALGRSYYWHRLALRDFASFLSRVGASHITTDLALRWAMQPADARASHWGNRLSVVRGFARHMVVVDPRTEIPPASLIAPGPRRRKAHIFTDENVRLLVQGARELPAGRRTTRGLRGWSCSTVMGLLAATGLRLGEACALNRDDVDLAQGILTIRMAKFGKSRLVPIHITTRAALRSYARERDRRHPTLRSPRFFVSDHGTRLDEDVVRRGFLQVVAMAGLGTVPGSRPRLHDLRHTFAVKTLLRWYREGLDVEQRIPVLSTYLGHTRVAHTYWYLSAVPELMDHARARLEKRLEGEEP